MKTRKHHPVFEWVRRALPLQLLAVPFGCITIPANPETLPMIPETPDGLFLLHAANSAPEADLLRQVLVEAGFHTEYVPPLTTGMFGTTGSRYIYVPQDEAQAAGEFLKEYLNPSQPLE